MSALPAILSVGTANPPQRYSQEEIYELAARAVPSYRNDRVRQIFLHSDIDHRHLAFDITRIDPRTETRDDLHERFKTWSMTIGREAVERALTAASLSATDIDLVVAVLCTGYLCPGLSALLVREMGMRRDVQRADVLGMGCAGAMPGLQRAYDFVKARAGGKALVLTVEICSACYYFDDSLETVVGNAICADGAAAVVIGTSADPAHPKIAGFETLIEPEYLEAVGFEHRDGRLRIVLSKDLRTAAGGLAARLIGYMLGQHGVAPDAVDHWIVHSGGRKVIESIRASLDLTAEQMRHSQRVLRNFGNMSSPTVLFVLEEAMRSRPAAGDVGVMLAMGPGLALESALLRW